MTRLIPVMTLLAGIGVLPLQTSTQAKDDKFDASKLIGTWKYTSGVRNGEKVDEANFKGHDVIITKDEITLKTPDSKYVIKYELDTKKSPVGIKLEMIDSPVGSGFKANGIIELKGDDLRLCYNPVGGESPKAFESKAGSEVHLFGMRRSK